MAQPAALPPPDDDQSPEKMSFLEHLDELRRRIIFAIISLAIAFVVCFTFSTQIYEFLIGPLMTALPEGGSLIATRWYRESTYENSPQSPPDPGPPGRPPRA